MTFQTIEHRGAHIHVRLQLGREIITTVKPFEELTKDRKLVDGVWIFDDGLGPAYTPQVEFLKSMLTKHIPYV